MASNADSLPEGIHSVTGGDTQRSGSTSAPGSSRAQGAGATSSAGAGGDAGSDEGSTIDRLRSHAAELGSQAAAKANDLREQATDQAFAFASQGKDRASEALEGAAKLINDAAAQIEERLGGSYGGYARQAGDTVAGFANSLRAKEVDELVEEARGFVKKSPALALGAAAAAGFLVARLIKAGGTTIETAARAADTAARRHGDDRDDRDDRGEG